MQDSVTVCERDRAARAGPEVRPTWAVTVEQGRPSSQLPFCPPGAAGPARPSSQPSSAFPCLQGCRQARLPSEPQSLHWCSGNRAAAEGKVARGRQWLGRRYRAEPCGRAAAQNILLVLARTSDTFLMRDFGGVGKKRSEIRDDGVGLRGCRDRLGPNNRSLFPHSSGGWMSEIPVLGVDSSCALCPGMWTAVFSLCPHMVVPLHVLPSSPYKDTVTLDEVCPQ